MSIMEIIGVCLGSSSVFSVITYLLTIRITRQKGKLDNEALAVKTLEEVIKQLREDKEEIIHEKDALEEKYAEECKKNVDLMNETILVKQNICVHFACAMRKPSRGLGAKWIDEHIDDETLGGDYLPINILLKNYGRNKEQLVKKAISEDTGHYNKSEESNHSTK